jgi:hypothetical protein
MRNLQLHTARGIGFDEVDKTPRDGALGNSLEQQVQSGAGREAAQEAAYGATGADVDGRDPQGGMRAPGFGDGVDLEFNVVDPNDFAPVDVDDLLIEQIAFEEEQSLGTVGGGPVRGTSGGVNIGVDGRDSGEGKDAVARFGFNNK